MDLGQLFTHLMQQREIEEQKRREAIARRLNERVFRNMQGPNKGNPIAQLSARQRQVMVPGNSVGSINKYNRYWED